MRYVILNAYDIPTLQGEVNAYIECGYTPLGGITHWGHQIMQALILPTVTVTLPDDENKT